MAPKSLANFVGTHLLPFTNPRVVCPPGNLRATGRPNLIVATPMRSGTHVLIDLILNNMPDYRNRPLYVDLDQCVKQSTADRDLLAQVTPDAGHVIKTHMPLSVPDSMASEPTITEVLEQGLVITVRRDRGDVCRSLARWHGIALEQAEAEYGPQYDQFWQFWTGRPQIELSFKDLFEPEKMRKTLTDLATASGTTPAKRYNPPPANTTKNRIYANKMMTRLAGRHAPRVDTTIHTLKF